MMLIASLIFILVVYYFIVFLESMGLGIFPVIILTLIFCVVLSAIFRAIFGQGNGYKY